MNSLGFNSGRGTSVPPLQKWSTTESLWHTPQDDQHGTVIDDIRTNIYTHQHPKRKNAVHKKGQVSKSFLDIATYVYNQHRDSKCQ